MVEIDVLYDQDALENIQKLAENCKEKCFEKAKYDALKKGKTELSKAIRESYTIKKSDIDKTIKIYNDSLNVKAHMLSLGPSGKLTSYPKTYTSQKGIKVKRRKKASATIKQGEKKSLKGTFIVNPEKTNGVQILFRRNEDDKLESVKTLSEAHMAINKDVMERTNKVIQESLQQRLEHYLEREAQKNANN